jgi:acetoin utilization deacetylase AcuC-like enzyme
MQVFYNAGEQAYAPERSFFTGRFTPYPEVPGRTQALLAWVQAQPTLTLETPPPVTREALTAVHDPGYVDTMAELCAKLQPEEAFFPFNMQHAPLLLRSPYPRIRMGYYALDGSTPLVPASHATALSAAATAQAGAQALLDGARHAYCLMRPPGHHAGRDTFGGYCLFNNAAVAAGLLAGQGKVAILDVDYHHGNGTQDIFFDRDDVLYVSLHCRPEEAYPYIAGSAEETGHGRGAGCNLNLPLPGGTDWAAYRPALEQGLAAIRRFAPDMLVLSAGFDTLADDPIGTFALLPGDMAPLGRLVGELGCPTLIVQEGGYHIPSLAPALQSLLEGLDMLG